MAESKLEENEVKEVRKRGRGRPKKEDNTSKEMLKKETLKKTGESAKISKQNKTNENVAKEKTTTIKKETTKSTSAKKADSEKEEVKKSKTPKSKTTAKTATKKETALKKSTRTTNKKIQKPELEKKVEKTEGISKKNKEEKELVLKKDISIDEEKLEKIQKEINKQTKLSKEEKKKINKKIFQNIVMAIGIVIYFIFINLGFSNIEESTYLTDLKVFGAVAIGITIILFEKAYKKDSGELTIYGIEMLIIAICTLLTNYIYKFHYSKYTYIITSIAMLFAVYYVGKSIVIYVKMKNKALKKASDIHKIVRK